MTLTRAETSTRKLSKTEHSGAGRRSASAIRPAIPPIRMVPSAGSGPPLVRGPAPLARRFQQVCASLVAQAFAGEDVMQLEYGSLIAIEIDPGLDQRRFAESMGIDPSHACLILDRLDAKSLIERRISAADRRARELYLTSKGKALWRRLRPKAEAARDQILAPLEPAERELFLDLLIRIIEGNREHARPGGGRRKRSMVQSSTNRK